MEFMPIYSDSFKENFLKALSASGGNVTAACKACKISRQTFYNWKSEHADFKQEVESIQEEKIDNVESALYRFALS